MATQTSGLRQYSAYLLTIFIQKTYTQFQIDEYSSRSKKLET